MQGLTVHCLFGLLGLLASVWCFCRWALLCGRGFIDIDWLQSGLLGADWRCGYLGSWPATMVGPAVMQELSGPQANCICWGSNADGCHHFKFYK